MANDYMSENEIHNMGISIGANALIHKTAIIIGATNITVDNNVRIDPYVVISAIGGNLSVGSYVHIGAYCYIAAGGGISIGNFSGLSQGVKIYSKSDDYSGSYLTNPTVPSEYTNVKVAPVKLEDHVIVGAGSVILPGVTVGIGTAVGALSLVGRDCDAWSIYAGSPVRRVKERRRDLLTLEKSLSAKSELEK